MWSESHKITMLKKLPGARAAPWPPRFGCPSYTIWRPSVQLKSLTMNFRVFLYIFFKKNSSLDLLGISFTFYIRLVSLCTSFHISSPYVHTSTKDPIHKDMECPIFLCYAAGSHLQVHFSLCSHSFKLGTLHCSLISDICQNDFKHVTIFMSIAWSFWYKIIKVLT